MSNIDNDNQSAHERQKRSMYWSGFVLAACGLFALFWSAWSGKLDWWNLTIPALGLFMGGFLVGRNSSDAGK